MRENETFLITRICEFTETWVVTQRDIEGHIKLHWSKKIKIQRTNMIASFSFTSAAHVTPVVELSNSTGWDFESTIKFNSSTVEKNCKWFVCGTKVAFSIKQLS